MFILLLKKYFFFFSLLFFSACKDLKDPITDHTSFMKVTFGNSKIDIKKFSQNYLAITHIVQEIQPQGSGQSIPVADVADQVYIFPLNPYQEKTVFIFTLHHKGLYRDITGVLYEVLITKQTYQIEVIYTKKPTFLSVEYGIQPQFFLKDIVVKDITPPTMLPNQIHFKIDRAKIKEAILHRRVSSANVEIFFTL